MAWPQLRQRAIRRAIPVVYGAYAGLAAALFAIMLVMNSGPGAVAALNVIRG